MEKNDRDSTTTPEVHACDFSVSPSPFGLDFGTLDFKPSDFCLAISFRCDQKSDCSDGSDEADCGVIKIDVTKYQKHIPPVEGTTVYLDVDMIRLNNIDEVRKCK